MSTFFKINVSTVIFNKEKDSVLIQKRSLNEKVFPGYWGIPGGGVEMTDKSAVEALKREVREEVGIEIDDIFFVKENIVAKEIYGVLYIIFVSKYLSGEAKPLEDTDEVYWVKEDELNNYEFTPTIKETISESFLWNKSHQ